jgi:hypothetical protein
MKIYRILCVASAMILPQLALAKLPFSNDALQAAERQSCRGLLRLCER